MFFVLPFISFAPPQLQQCIAVSQKASDKIFQFYRDSVRRRYSKNLWVFLFLIHVYLQWCCNKRFKTTLGCLCFSSVAVSCAVGEVSDLCGCWWTSGQLSVRVQNEKRKMNVKQVHLLGVTDFSVRLIFTCITGVWSGRCLNITCTNKLYLSQPFPFMDSHDLCTSLHPAVTHTSNTTWDKSAKTPSHSRQSMLNISCNDKGSVRWRRDGSGLSALYSTVCVCVCGLIADEGPTLRDHRSVYKHHTRWP